MKRKNTCILGIPALNIIGLNADNYSSNELEQTYNFINFSCMRLFEKIINKLNTKMDIENLSRIEINTIKYAIKYNCDLYFYETYNSNPHEKYFLWMDEIYDIIYINNSFSNSEFKHNKLYSRIINDSKRMFENNNVNSGLLMIVNVNVWKRGDPITILKKKER